MHDDQIDISERQVRALVAEQLPALSELDVNAVDGAGTVNAIYRIGNDVAARFPLRPAEPNRMQRRLRREMKASVEFRRACPAAAPEPIYVGDPGHGYPLPWAAQTWVPGTTATPTCCQNSIDLADDLAQMLRLLRDADTRGRRFRGKGRGGLLSDHDAWVEHCIQRSEGLLDTSWMRSAWQQFRLLPVGEPDVMCHGDLIPSNVLVADGRLTGILDTGGFQAADPSLDLVSAWHLLDDEPREHLRQSLGCGELEWERGKAWAFQQAAGAYWYYRMSNPSMAGMGRTTLERLAAYS